MKTTDWLRDQLPSANDLLNSPKLRPLIDSLSRNEVAIRVRAFLEETQSQLQQKLTDLELPPLGELVDRVADRIQRAQQPAACRAINATGTIFDATRDAVPLAETAIERMAAAARDFNAGIDAPGGRGGVSEAGLAEVRQALRRTFAFDDVFPFHSYSAAQFVAARALAERSLVVAEPSQAAPDALDDQGLLIQRVQPTADMSAREIADLLPSEAKCIYWESGGTRRDDRLPPSEILAGAAESRGAIAIHGCRRASWIDLSPWGLAGDNWLATLGGSGADLLLVDGGRWIGGPSCGLALGKSEVVGRLRSHPLATAMAASSLTLLGLATTLQLYAGRTRPELVIPVLQLLTTPLENLQLRAQRLAAQLQGESSLSAEAVACRSQLDEEVDEESSTWAVAIRPQEGDVDGLHLRLASAPYPVLARKESGQVVIDMRTVFTRQDIRLLAAIRKASGADTTSEVDLRDESGSLAVEG